MKITDIITEGGYASTLTQDTKVTPAMVQTAVGVFDTFVQQFNKFLKSKNLPPVKAGHPVGSTHYYKQDLVSNPDKTYGDIDILFFIPKLPGSSDGANVSTYTNAVTEFVSTANNISTNSGKNLVFQMGSEYLQIDLVMAYYENRDWLPALLPERGIKGVISSTVYSSVAEVMNISVNSQGVQVKLRGGMPVSFRQSKDTEVRTISKNPRTWALDVLKFFHGLANTGSKLQVSDSLQQASGVDPAAVRIADNVQAITGLADSLELNGLLAQGALSHVKDSADFMAQVRSVYQNKMQAAMNSTKFDKGQAAQVTADRDKLQKGLDMVLGLMT